MYLAFTRNRNMFQFLLKLANSKIGLIAFNSILYLVDVQKCFIGCWVDFLKYVVFEFRTVEKRLN